MASESIFHSCLLSVNRATRKIASAPRQKDATRFSIGLATGSSSWASFKGRMLIQPESIAAVSNSLSEVFDALSTLKCSMSTLPMFFRWSAVRALTKGAWLRGRFVKIWSDVNDHPTGSINIRRRYLYHFMPLTPTKTSFSEGSWSPGAYQHISAICNL